MDTFKIEGLGDSEDGLKKSVYQNLCTLYFEKIKALAPEIENEKEKVIFTVENDDLAINDDNLSPGLQNRIREYSLTN